MTRRHGARPTRRTDDRPSRRAVGGWTLAAVVASLLLLVAGAAGPAAATEHAPSFTVDLHADGSATVAMTLAFDLTGDAEREAFRSLETDQAARTGATDRFLSRMRSVANATAATTGREMAVRDARIEVGSTDDGATGIVTLSVEWIGLAAERDGRLVLTEPFASEFTPDRRFVVTAPDGYAVVEAMPEPAVSSGSSLEWAAGSSLDGFRVVVAPVDGESGAGNGDGSGGDGTDTPGQPGLGILAAVVALLLAVGIRAVRR